MFVLEGVGCGCGLLGLRQKRESAPNNSKKAPVISAWIRHWGSVSYNYFLLELGPRAGLFLGWEDVKCGRKSLVFLVAVE